MIKEIWFNLPVKDIKKSKEFFTNIGFAFDTKYGNTDVSAAMRIGSKGVVIMLFSDSVFKTFTRNELTDTSKSSEILISFDVENKEEVDSFAAKVKSAGGNVFSEPNDVQGWMYGCAFTDPDGHRWNVLHMDMSKMPG